MLLEARMNLREALNFAIVLADQGTEGVAEKKRL